MKYFLGVLLLILPFSIFSQENISTINYDGSIYNLFPVFQNQNHNPYPVAWIKEIKLTREELKKYKRKDRKYFKKEEIATFFPKDGKWIQLYHEDTSRVAKVFDVKNGLPNGKYQRFNLLGELLEEGDLLNGARYGEFNFYPDSSSYGKGAVYSKGEYMKPPDSTYYHSVFIPYYHITDEGKTGKWEYKDKKSNLSKIENYRAGKLEGKTIEYYPNGTIKMELNYELGLKSGMQIAYHKNGGKAYEKNYRNGLREGVFKEWYKDGKLKCDLIYDQDTIKEGECFLYYPTGEKLGEGQLEGDVKIGHWIFWYENGTKRAEGNYKTFETIVCVSAMPREYVHSVKAGRWIYWYPNGKELAHGDYLAKKKQISRGEIYTPKMNKGKWQFKNLAGEIIELEEFENYELLDFEKIE